MFAAVNPWVILAAVVALAGSYGYGRHDGRKLEIASQAKAEEIAKREADALTKVAVDAITSLRPQFTTIKQDTIRETRYEPRYVDPGCNHTDAVWLQLGAAYEAAGGSLGGGAGLPAATVPGGSDAAGDNPRPH